MSRGSLARRYAPLLAVGALQLLIIATVPSKAPNVTAAATEAPSAQDVATGSDAAVDVGSGATDTGSVTGGATSVGGGVTGGTTTGGVGGGGTVGGTVADISHCVSGRQFDPAIDFYAPPCVGKFTGKNPGATYPGVTANKIEIVVYRDKGNDQVNELLKASGGYVYPEDEQQFIKVAEKFINDHYELWGRKVHIDYFQGQCTSIPPDTPCMRDEMRKIADTYHPYFVKWATTLCSECYDQLSKDRIPNAGGYYFRDQFSQERRPYHWDVQMSGTLVDKHFAEFWCGVLKDKPVAYAGTDNPADNKNGKPRKLGIIGTNDPDNDAMIKDLIGMLRTCNIGYDPPVYEYAQDINTAATQKRDGVDKMRSNGATDVLCLCDQVAPQFLYQEEKQEAYFPENLIAGTGFMDTDTAGQSYDKTLCPGEPCREYENAFGLSSQMTEEKDGADAAARVRKVSGVAGGPAHPYPHVLHDWEYFNMIATLIQGSGPNLTPANMEAGAFKAGFVGGGTTGRIKRGFAPGSYAWNHDMRVVYWSTRKTSTFNGSAGTYVQVDGTRHELGSYAGMSFALPPKPR